MRRRQLGEGLPMARCWLGLLVLSSLAGTACSTGGGQGGGGHYYPPPPPPPPEYGGRGQQQQGPPPPGPPGQGPPQGYYPPRQGGPGPQQQPPPPPPAGGQPGYYQSSREPGPRGPSYPGPPPPYGPGAGSGYGGYPGSQQQQQGAGQQQQEGGFWSKLKNTVKIFTDTDEGSQSSGPDTPYGLPPPYPGMRPSPDGRALPPALPAGGPPGSGPPGPRGPPQTSGPYPGMSPWAQQQQQQQEQPQQQQQGLWARLTQKVINGAQSVLEPGPSQGGREPPAGPPGYPRGPYGGPGNMYPGSEGGSLKPPSRGPGPYGGPYGQQQQGPPPHGGPGGAQQGPGGAFGQRPGPGSAPPPPRGPFYPGGEGPYGMMDRDGPAPPAEPAAPEEVEEEEALPDIFTVGDNIVLVNKPHVLRQKLDRFARAGPSALQVITSFDGGLTRFQTADNRRKSETTESLLHNAVLMPGTRSKLRAVLERFDKEYAAAGSFEERYANRENLKREVQRIVATEGQIYISSIPAAVQDFQSMLPVRSQLESVLKPLAYHGVPVYLFCAGYGEVLAQLLRLACPGLHTPEGYLPPTLRIVSNLFRTGPDGLVNGFTYPAIHELNSNMTTAKEFRFPEVGSNRMMPPMMMHHHQPPQPISRNALVITGSLAEHDVAAGLGTEEQLRVGYIERGRLMELPRYLEAFDAVVLGDGGMQYVSQLIEHVLGGGGQGPTRAQGGR